MLSAGLPHFLTIAAILFAFGVFCIVTKRNAVMLLMGVELVLNAANINFVAFSRFGPPGGGPVVPGQLGPMMTGQVASLFVILLAACEAAVALAIVLNIYKRFGTINVDEIDMLRD
jgi:NADH-quinone oxidoreductase subunit K